MWENRRLLAALAAMPPEAFIDGPPEDGELLWRRAARRLRPEAGLEPATAPDHEHVAPVVNLPLAAPSD